MIPESENKATPRRNQLSVGINFLYYFIDIPLVLHETWPFCLILLLKNTSNFVLVEDDLNFFIYLFFYLFLELPVLSIHRTDLLSSQLQTSNPSQHILENVLEANIFP